eukprot:TRINITY_DN4566_c0_g1_i2.p1 TRINITY_DN4566_c0_g1~~TRINITY_DN4566_c0_g1_i2.p1  ORF type:complete len:239 (+),score=40.10 TRINITY_DN4566_c0_g1_i2:50-766(+)
MIQQMQTYCPECRGAGEAISDANKCTECRGEKVVKERKIIEVNITKGMKHGERINFHGESNQLPGVLAGDLIVVLTQSPHSTFERKGDDLHYQKTIPLVEALTGTTFPIEHLDDRVLLVKSGAGDIIADGEIRSIQNEGMPMKKNPFTKGNLYIHFKIKYPASGTFNAEQLKLLEKVLGPKDPLPKLDGKNVQNTNLGTYSVKYSTDSRDNGRRGQAYDSDEDEDDRRHGPNVGCTQQ